MDHSLTLPSLSTGNIKKISLTRQEFRESVPIFTRSRISIFDDLNPIPRLRSPLKEEIPRKSTTFMTLKTPPATPLQCSGVVEIGNDVQIDQTAAKAPIRSSSKGLLSLTEKLYINKRSNTGKFARFLLTEAEKESLRPHTHTSAHMQGLKSNSLKEVKRDEMAASVALANSHIADDDTVLSSEKSLSVAKELADHRDKYVGDRAAKELQSKYRTAPRTLLHYATNDSLPVEMQTPRTIYMRETTRSNLIPLPLLLRKEIQPNGVFLAHRGLGDAYIMPLIKVIDTLPAIQTIDLCDNRLTDTSLIPLVAKLWKMPYLTHLDLSFNDIDESSEEFVTFLRSEDCVLKTV